MNFVTFCNRQVFGILVIWIVGFDCKDVEKRSIVSRFTTNPFFLRHFDGFRNYEISRQGYYADTDWNSGEELEEYNIVPQFQESDEDLSPEEYVSEDEEPLVIPILPENYFANVIIKEAEPIEVVFPYEHKNNFSTESNKNTTLLTKEESLFHTLPLFDKSETFNANHNSVKKILIKQESPESQFVSIPITEKIETLQDLTNSNNSETVVYIFSSLPHFDRQISFRQKNSNLIEKANDEILEVLTNLKKEEDLSGGVIPIFKSLPHFDRQISFIEVNSNQNFKSVQEENPQDAVTPFFTNLPVFDKSQNFNDVAPFVSIVTQEPQSQVTNFQTQPRKVVKKVIRKKIFNNSDEFEFGKRLQPLVRVRSVADLPLEKNQDRSKLVADSYGKLVASKFV